MEFLMLSAAILIILVRFTFFKNCSEIANKRFLIFSGFILIMILGLRNGVVNYGSDLNNYYRLFDRAISSTTFSGYSRGYTYETGYLLLNWLISRIIKWPQFFLFFQAFFCIGITFRFIYKHSCNMLLSVLGFMSFGLMQFYLTGFRQAMAIALCLVAIEMAEKKRLLSFVFLIIVASCIHQTSIVFAIAYVFVQIPVNKKTVVLDAILILGLSQLIPRLILFGNDIFEKNYTGAFIGNQTGGLINLMIAGMILLIMWIQLGTRCKYGIRYEGTKKRIINGSSISLIHSYSINYKLMHLLVIGTGFYAMRYQALILERISFYFTPVMFILLPQIIEKGFSKESRKLVRLIFICGMLFLIYWRMKNIIFIPFWA